ncbi:hypothetical protein [Acinetobacter sp. Marseille-Q1618]|uniref:hypothetical protein n=1 Tax=Acinetobacter sp. Marseille-Q1618 TaxID=2697502 RepID=UPI0015713C3E|nr:hypothetical protein [Acinetobacter sp. Marseille-Q1618]
MNHLKTTVLLSVFLITNTTYAELVTYQYDDGTCEVNNKYDNKKFTKKQLDDTIFLSQSVYGLKIDKDNIRTPPSPNEINKLNLGYQDSLRKFQNLDIPKIPKYQQLKKIALTQLKQEHQLNMYQAKSFENPKILLTKEYGDKCYAIAQKLNAKGKNMNLETFLDYQDEWINCVINVRPDHAIEIEKLKINTNKDLFVKSEADCDY